MALSIHEMASVRTGLLFGSGRVIEYRVEGSSPDDEAFVANFGSWQHDNWKILRVKDGAGAEWIGNYSSADEAFVVLRVEHEAQGSRVSKMRAFPFRERPCPGCSLLVPSTVVYTTARPNRGVNYAFHDCATCGQIVGRIVGYDIANPNGNNHLFTEAVTSQEELEAVLQAGNNAQEM